ncbi:hypothetical protein M885DRAFT_548150 [Pelagophyceae sp. CCMP2097]|nr:hypothetical protein M885DRAFT_548150 [Pelagophyceae sp. CCMP2097]
MASLYASCSFSSEAAPHESEDRSDDSIDGTDDAPNTSPICSRRNRGDAERFPALDFFGSLFCAGASYAGAVDDGGPPEAMTYDEVMTHAQPSDALLFELDRFEVLQRALLNEKYRLGPNSPHAMALQDKLRKLEVKSAALRTRLVDQQLLQLESQAPSRGARQGWDAHGYEDYDDAEEPTEALHMAGTAATPPPTPRPLRAARDIGTPSDDSPGPSPDLASPGAATARTVDSPATVDSSATARVVDPPLDAAPHDQPPAADEQPAEDRQALDRDVPAGAPSPEALRQGWQPLQRPARRLSGRRASGKAVPDAAHDIAERVSI